ncbi:MAG: Hsp20 family protein [Dehalococcoidia bacterium]
MADVTVTTPFRDLAAHMRRLMQEEWPFRFDGDLAREGTLAVDVAETDNEIVVRASVPGVRREDIEVQFDQGVLAIKASREEEQEEKGGRYYRRERYTGSVSRRVAMPGMVGSAEQVSAELADAVLTVRIPVAEQARPRKIEVHAAS